ncbi:S1 RNA-binding domain-containing protein [Klebsiella pneumoniae]|nr:S1 RNA-binding domain-containing protein [Klebsiella pneumoniae]
MEFKIPSWTRSVTTLLFLVVPRLSNPENSAERDHCWKPGSEGMEVKGIVKNLTDYGAFVDLGGADGLLHITDMAWKNVKHPSEIVTLATKSIVKALKFDRERTRVSWA